MQAWAHFRPMTHFKFQTWPNTILPLEKFSLLWKTCAAVKYLLWVNKASHRWLKSASKSENFTDDVIISKRSCDWEGISQTRSNISGLYPWNFLNSVLLLIIRPLKSTTKFRQHLFAVTVIHLSWATEGRPLQVLLTVSTRRVTSVVARLFHEESTLTILKRGEVDKTLPGVTNTKISKIPKTETFRGDVQIIILVITAWKDIVFGRSWQMCYKQFRSAFYAKTLTYKKYTENNSTHGKNASRRHCGRDLFWTLPLWRQRLGTGY